MAVYSSPAPELLGFVIAGLWVHRPVNLPVYG